ncbi:MAG: hypothetical protein JWM75_1785 [Sphingomonas bacterium]|nr:hypothetical protein [Sphingomonas bacterium]
MVIGRRTLLKSVAALAGAAALAGKTGAAAPAPLFVFDRRAGTARQLALAAAKRGAAIRPIAGDVTALWAGELSRRWATHRGAVSGATTAETLRCLEILARGNGMAIAEAQAIGEGLVAWRIAPARRSI